MRLSLWWKKRNRGKYHKYVTHSTYSNQIYWFFRYMR